MMRASVIAWGAAMVLAGVGSITGATLNAQGREGKPSCDNVGTDRPHFCEVRSVRMRAEPKIEVDGGTNGGVTVEGWDQGDVLVEAQVEAWAESDDDARDIARDVHLRTEDGRIRAEGPGQGGWRHRHEGWAVSFTIHVPHRTDLSLETTNGGVTVNDVGGTLRFRALNGGVHLAGLSGDVEGSTTNGGVHVDLAGPRWDGAGLNVRTMNGGVRLRIPRDYSAHLVTGTVNGGIRIDFPVTVQGRIDKRLAVDLGQGGPPVEVRTTNGGVTVERR